MAKYITLNTGAEMPLVGLGMLNVEDMAQTLEAAVQVGYRHFDSAWLYGNEAAVGRALKNLFDKGTVKREELFIVTKLWCFFHSKDKVEGALRESLNDLGLHYVDLYLIHIPMAFKRPADPLRKFPQTEDIDNIDLTETWKGMEEVCRKGLTKAIGLSNFNQQQVQRIYDHAQIKPANLQVECHVHWPQFELHELCSSLGISLTAYAPLGAPTRFCKAATELVVLEDPVVVGLAEKYNKTPAQIALRWLIQRGIVVIPKSKNPERIRQNFQVWDFSMSDEDLKALSNLKQKQRLYHLNWLPTTHPDFPWPEELG